MGPQPAPPYGQPYPPYAQPYPYGYPYAYPYPYAYAPGPAVRDTRPAKLPYDEGAPPPPGYRLDTEVRKGLVIGGAVTFGVMWSMTLLAAALTDIVRNAGNEQDEPRDEGATPLIIPVAGPFIAIYTLDSEGGATSLLILDGVAQGAGAAMLIAGLTSKRKVWVKQYAGVELQVAPVAVGNRDLGLGLQGRF